MGVQAQGKKEMKSLLTRPSSLEMLKKAETVPQGLKP
jgi:hypothetical protein